MNKKRSKAKEQTEEPSRKARQKSQAEKQEAITLRF